MPTPKSVNVVACGSKERRDLLIVKKESRPKLLSSDPAGGKESRRSLDSKKGTARGFVKNAAASKERLSPKPVK